MRAAALATLLTLGACTPVPEIPESNRIDVAGFMTRLDEGERTWLMQDVVSLFGSPTQRDSTARQHTLEWYGLALTFSGSRITMLAFTDARHTSPEGLRVGFAATHVLQGLGPPLEEEETRYTYVTENDTRIHVYLEEGRVQRVEWRYETTEE